MNVRRCIPIALLALVAPSIAAAADPLTTSVRVPRPSGTSAEAVRHAERRIAEAALEACGASSYSPAAVRDAVARSRCWQDADAAGMAQLSRPATRAVASLPPSRTMGEP